MESKVLHFQKVKGRKLVELRFDGNVFRALHI